MNPTAPRTMNPTAPSGMNPTAPSFQDLILRLQGFWARQGCVILQPYDVEMGAGTFHPATTLRALGPKPWRAAYVQPSRRPSDGRYGENPNRLQHYYQYQVIMKPSPADAQELLLASYREIGLDPLRHDFRFVEDDWESPTLGAWGLGWEVWCDGMEVTQYTYFQQVGGLDVFPVAGELTYGLERLALYVQGVESVYDLAYNDPQSPDFMTYGDVFLENERQFSAFEQEAADVGMLKREFEDMEREVPRLLASKGRRGQPPRHRGAWHHRGKPDVGRTGARRADRAGRRQPKFQRHHHRRGRCRRGNLAQHHHPLVHPAGCAWRHPAGSRRRDHACAHQQLHRL